jgi:hypothetical protein
MHIILTLWSVILPFSSRHMPLCLSVDRWWHIDIEEPSEVYPHTYTELNIKLISPRSLSYILPFVPGPSKLRVLRLNRGVSSRGSPSKPRKLTFPNGQLCQNWPIFEMQASTEVVNEGYGQVQPSEHFIYNKRLIARVTDLHVFQMN